MSTARTEAFSDGVLAIAITLLVLDLRVPEVNGGLWHALVKQWPSYASYAVSFLVIGIIWINHHAVFAQIARTDRTLLILNLIVLMTVAFIPFPTAVLARYLRAGHDEHVAAAVYTGTFAVMGAAFGSLWMYASHNGRLLKPGLSPTEIRSLTRSFVLGTPLYAIAIGIAFVNASLCLALNALLAIFYVVERGGAMRLRAPDGEPD